MRNIVRSTALGVLLLTWMKYLQAEEIPFFRAEPQYPNVFIIFDNSDSMQDVPYLSVDGVSVRPSGRRWQENVVLDGNKRVTGWTNVTWPDVLPWLDENANPTRLASGGNHPASKLYQAKLALNVILDHIKDVNLGFATYMTDRVPRVTAKYYRILDPVAGSTTDDPLRWEVLERQTGTSTYSTNVTSTSGTSFTWCSRTITGSVGTTFRVPRTCIQGSPPDTLSGTCDLRNEEVELTITNVVPEYKDGSIFQYRWYFSGTYRQYRITTITDASNTYDPSTPSSASWYSAYPASGGPRNLPPPASGWMRIENAPGCRVWRKYDPPPVTSGGLPRRFDPRDPNDTSSNTWRTTTGNWSVTDPAAGGYINPLTLEVTPNPTDSGWTLVPDGGVPGWRCNSVYDTNWWCVPTNESVPGVCNITTTRCDRTPGRYRDDIFRYPGYGTTDRPHAWSYVKRTGNRSGSASNKPPWGTWKEAEQPDPFFPGVEGSEDGNVIGDDHIAFVNLPPGNTNDTALLNKEKIRRYVALDRFSGHPRYTGYDYTTMPFTTSIAPNSDQVSTWPSGGGGKATPLTASLRWAKRYFESYIRQDGQSLIYCRQNYIILLTDGLETAECDPAAADYNTCLTSETDPRSPVKAAKDLRNIVIDGQAYEVKTYVIGFGMEASQREALNLIAKAGGTEKAKFADDAQELAEKLSDIFSEIGTNYYTRSDLTITREGDRIFMAYFEYPGWRGHLAKFSVDQQTGEVTRCGEDNTCVEWGGTGDAGSALNKQANRTVYTTVGSGAEPGRILFSTSNISSLKSYLLSPADDINSNGTPYENVDAEAVINFILDPGYSGGIYAGTRDRNWKLADLYHTRPVVVGKPAYNYTFNDYTVFKSTYSERDTTVYVGSNGGMLHAFKARRYGECDSNNVGKELCDDTGEERWAYIPKMALPNLKNLRIEHQFYVDSPPAVSDVYSEGTGGSVFHSQGWYTVLVSGMREGGRGYFALDVTDPGNPRVLWEFTDTNGTNNMGYTWSVPAIGRVRIGTKDKWVAIVGGGWSDPSNPANSNVGNRIYMIDIETGDILKQGKAYAEWTIGTATNRVPSAIRAVDMDKNGYIDKIYFGDTSGVMWRMDVSSNNMEDWVPCKLFDPSAPNWHTNVTSPPSLVARPMFYPPAVVKGDSGYNLVLFGTGDEINPSAINTQDYFLEVEDRGNLVPGSPATCTGRINWIMELPRGEKVLSKPDEFNRIVYFTTYSPSGQCGAGTGYLYAVTVSRGINSTGGGEAGFEYNEKGESLDQDKRELKREIGTGVPTSPLVTHGAVYTTTSNLPGNPLEGAPPIRRHRTRMLSGEVRAWREVF